MEHILSLPKLLFAVAALGSGLSLAALPALKFSQASTQALGGAWRGPLRRAWLWLPFLLLTVFGSLWLALLFLGPIWGLPKWRAHRARRRDGAAQAEQLPGLLEAMAAGLRAGLSLPQSLEAAAEDLPEPSQSLCRRLQQGLRLGEAPELLLAREASAWEGALAADGRLLATAVGIQRESGGDLSAQLDQLVETLRERQRLQAQVDALTAQGRLSAWVVGLLPLVLLLALQLLEPALLAPLFHSTTGLFLLGVGALLEAAGILLLRRIVDIQA